MPLRHILVGLGLALAIAPLAVQAQEPAAAPIGLQIDGGSVLVSTGAVVAGVVGGVAVIAAVAGGGGSDDPTPVSR